jgi:hypothetical protein
LSPEIGSVFEVICASLPGPEIQYSLRHSELKVQSEWPDSLM